MPALEPTPAWRLGAWSEDKGYPASVAYHDGRQVFAGGRSTEMRRRVDGSAQPGFNRFSPGEGDDADAFTVQLAAQGEIAHMLSSQELLIMTTDEERALSGAQRDPITPSSAQDRHIGQRGSADVRPLTLGATGMFVDQTQQALVELAYDALEEGYRGPDMALLAKHIVRSVGGGGGIMDMAFVTRPHQVVYCVRDDGVLLAFTYLREEQVTGWSRLHVGDGAGSVKSVAVLPHQPNDDLYAVVRYGGQQFIQVMEQTLTVDQSPDEAMYLDSAVTWEGTFSGRVRVRASGGGAPTSGKEGVATSEGGEFYQSDVGQQIQFSYAETDANGEPVRDANGNVRFHVAIAAITGYIDGDNVEVLIAADFPSDGWMDTARRTTSMVSGLGHLEGRTVSVIGTGRQQSNKVVTNGTVTLDYPASMVHVGLGYAWRWTTLPLETGSRQGTSQGKPTNISRALVRVVQTRGLEMGAADGQKFNQTFPASVAGRFAPLVTGDLETRSGTGWKRGVSLTLGHNSAYPATVVLIVPHSQTGEAT